MDPFEGDEAWRDLIFLALDHATGSIEAPDVGPLIPFAMTHGPDGRQLVRFAGTDYATDCASALRFAHEGGFLHWAVAWDGFLIMDWLRRLEEAKHIPVIIITGGDPEKLKDRAMAAGAIGFFQKPINSDDLLASIRDTIGESPAVPPTA